MIRTLLGLTAALTVASSAYAQTTESVRLEGQGARAIKVQLLQAATRVCRAAQDPLFPADYDYQSNDTCVSNTYSAALRQAKRANPEAFRRVAAQTVAER